MQQLKLLALMVRLLAQGYDIEISKRVKMSYFRRVLRLSTLLVIAINVFLAYFDIINIKNAVFITIILEFLIGLLFMFFVGQGIRRYRESRAQGASFNASAGVFFAEILPRPILKLAKHELDMWRLISFLVRRKINVPDGAITFRYGSEQRAVFIALLIVSIVEIAVVEVIVPWNTVRIIVIVLSIYGAIWLVLFFLSFRINPHYLHDGHLVLRVGLLAKIRIELKDIASISAIHRTWENKFLSVSDGNAVIKHGSDTNVQIRLREPILGLGDTASCFSNSVYCAVDDPKMFTSTVKTRML
ncbi:hypothetical protein [Corynebacterium freiburgense]|uniref:hypothetical protein n=1 Tax=Corynebacterium freiburgense TaxID=556548 RepID=UPI0003FA2F1B|nr:hypothetical protein [Corynebacterium freiburgense]WJZ03912.1 hypothetical protein CFREI_13305 [Corynebacterium freiburgense]